MLNELYKLSMALQHHDLLVSTTHPNISTVGKGDCIIFELDSEGVPQNLRLLKKDKSINLWKHSKGNHNNFPAIRIQKPFLSISESKKIDESVWNKAKLSEKTELLKTLDFTSVNPHCSEILLSEWSRQELASVMATDQPELAALRSLISVFPNESTKDYFLGQLLKLLKDKIADSDETLINYFKELLVGKLDPKTGRYKVGCMTYYDVYEKMKYKNLVFSEVTRSALITLLNQEQREDSPKYPSPLSGEITSGIGQKYPNPNIPLLGQTYLYSKKSDIPCLTRYFLTGANAFQAGKDEISKINDALAFLTAESRKNKTWRAISDSNRDKPNLLLAYLADDPANDALLAQILGDPSDSDDVEEYQILNEKSFENLCEQVLKELKKAINKKKESKVCLILLESLDPGRKQVVYESAFTVEQLCQNLTLWNEASKNHPPIKIDLQCPGPNDICKLFKLNYTRSGTINSTKIGDVSLHDIYSLYMPVTSNERNPWLIDHFLWTMNQKSFYLMSDVGSKQSRSRIYDKSMASQLKNASLFISLYSILLYFKGIRKEIYMNEAPFNIGQLLKLSDLLHREYTIQVRNNGDRSAPLPPQLMGNELLSVACENPNEALDRLTKRIRIYQAWAFTTVGETSRYPRWILKRLEEVCRKIAMNELPETFTNAQTAQVLLGYLADIPKEKQNENEMENEEETTNE